MYHWNIKFQEKIFTCKKVIQLWNFGNFGISEIIPKTLVTLRFLKVSLHELKSNCKCFQMRHWPIFYIHPTHNSTHFSTWPGRKITNAHDCTLVSLIIKHAHFLYFQVFSILLALIRSCLFSYFKPIFSLLIYYIKSSIPKAIHQGKLGQH